MYMVLSYRYMYLYGAQLHVYVLIWCSITHVCTQHFVLNTYMCTVLSCTHMYSVVRIEHIYVYGATINYGKYARRNTTHHLLYNQQHPC